MIVPITRKEKLLNAIATSGNVDFLPKTREELFLFKILGADVNTPTPITRKELLYQHIIDGTIPTFEPRTRLEKFIMVAAGAELELPVVLTREEYWWAEISDSAYETITGAIVHFISKRARAIKSLIANISYTQDLHGYSYPWPAGGGKNLLNPDTVTKTSTIDYANGIWTMNPFNTSAQIITVPFASHIGDSVTVSFTAWASDTTTARFDGQPDSVCTSGTDFSDKTVNLTTNKNRFSYSGTILDGTTGFRIFRTSSIVGAQTVSIYIENIQIEVGSTATTYSPYANICPISGWTGANVTRTGKNLLNSNTITQNKIIDNTGAIVTNNAIEITDYIRVKPSTQYVLSGTSLNGKSSNADVRVNFYTADKTWKYRSGTNKTNGLIFTTDADTYFVRFSFSKDSTDQMCEEGSTATPFVAYNGSTYSITFPSEAGTVYGGTLDIVTGELTVTSAKITPVISDYQSINSYGIVNWRIRTPNCTNYDGKHGSNALQQQTSTIASTKNEGFYISSSTYSYIRLLSSRATTSAEANQVIADNGVYIVYELAEPITYQLTPTEVTTLLGDNTIWADTGDVSVTY